MIENNNWELQLVEVNANMTRKCKAGKIQSTRSNISADRGGNGLTLAFCLFFVFRLYGAVGVLVRS